jgi:hypothetical protein
MANIDLTFVGEQLQRVLQELGEVRNEQHQMRQELAANTFRTERDRGRRPSNPLPQTDRGRDC